MSKIVKELLQEYKEFKEDKNMDFCYSMNVWYQYNKGAFSKNPIKRIFQEFEIFINEEKMYTHYEGRNVKRKSLLFLYFLLFKIEDIFIFYKIKKRILNHICSKKGHKIICEDWGNPESGGIAGTCTRCGYSYSHILY